MTVHPRIDVSLPAIPSSAPALRTALRSYLESAAVGDERLYDVLVAAGEAAGNAIEHAYRDAEGSVRLRAEIVGRRLTVVVSDGGDWRIEGGDADRGRGLGIMEALVDEVAIENTDAGTDVRLTVYRV